jgi:hypothetical protein
MRPFSTTTPRSAPCAKIANGSLSQIRMSRQRLPGHNG